jgi:RNA recognition motif-containing protein
VTGFSRQSRREDIESHFSRGRDCIQHVIMKSRFAFIDFKYPEDAAEAVASLDNSEFEGRKLVV